MSDKTPDDLYTGEIAIQLRILNQNMKSINETLSFYMEIWSNGRGTNVKDEDDEHVFDDLGGCPTCKEENENDNRNSR